MRQYSQRAVNNNNSLHKLLHCHIFKKQFLSWYRQTIGRTDRTNPLGTEPVVLKSIVTVQCRCICTVDSSGRPIYRAHRSLVIFSELINSQCRTGSVRYLCLYILLRLYIDG